MEPAKEQTWILRAEWRLRSEVQLTSHHESSCRPINLLVMINYVSLLKGHWGGIGQGGGSGNEEHSVPHSCCHPVWGGCLLPVPAIHHGPTPTQVAREVPQGGDSLSFSPLLTAGGGKGDKLKGITLKCSQVRPVCGQRRTDFPDMSVRADIIFLLIWGHFVWCFLRL